MGFRHEWVLRSVSDSLVAILKILLWDSDFKFQVFNYKDFSEKLGCNDICKRCTFAKYYPR